MTAVTMLYGQPIYTSFSQVTTSYR